MKTKYLVGLSVASGLALATAGVSFAQDMIGQRKALMKEVGGATKLSSEMIKGEKPFDAKAAAIAAKEAEKGPDAFKAAFGAVGGTCKGCHEVYRVPKK